MVFSNTTDNNGLIQDCESWVFQGDYGKISGNTTLLTRFTNAINKALEDVVTQIREAEGRWQWDDSNDTDFPIATTALVTNQQDYSLDATSHYRIERVEVMDTGGNWGKLAPIDQAELYNQSLTDFLKTASNPIYYDKVGNSLFLYPKPNYSQAASLKVFFERGPSYFATTDTTKTAGFNPLFHRLLSMKASLEYAQQNSISVAGGVMRGGYKTGLLSEVSDLEDQLATFYAKRDKDEHTTLRARVINYR